MKITEQIAAFLAVLFGGCRGVAAFRARTVNFGVRDESTLKLAGDAPPVIPLGLLKRLAEQPWPPEICVRAATTEALGALALLVPTRGADTSVLERLLAFPARPTLIIDAATSLVAVWRLDAPRELPREGGPAGRLLHQLARALEVPTSDEELPVDAWVALPGSGVREAGCSPVPIVELVHATSAVYSFAALEDAASKGGPLCVTR